TAVYVTVRDMEWIAAHPEFEEKFAFLEKHIHLDKVYLETYRGQRLIEKEKVLKIKEIFTAKGIKVSGGITPDLSASWEFKSFCYSNQEHLDRLREIVAYTAELFDEIILDDFYFTNCKCESCIRAKADRSWSEFRIERLKQVSEEIIVKTAKRTTPRVNLLIKYPNWYDAYQSVGYNLREEPLLFDQLYTGTETRDPRYTQQTLQRYLSYFLIRYLENVKPGGNGGGWFDTFDCRYNLGSYAEQCYLTLFAKAREVTLFCFGLLLTRDSIFIPITGYVFEQVDKFLGELGNPVGIPCYKPYHSSGENYLHSFLGMLGLPLEPHPEFTTGKGLLLLTASAAKDELIVERIKNQLLQGRNVAVTSGLLRALTGRGIEEIAEIRYTDHKVAVDKFAYPTYECSFGNYFDSARPILIPQIEFSTNDCIPLAVAFAKNKVYPLLLQVKYGAGILYVLTVPENFGDLYDLPNPVLNLIRRKLTAGIGIRLEGPANIGLFVYDNNTFIVESFLPYHSDVKVVIEAEGLELLDLVTGERVPGREAGGTSEFEFKLAPTTYRVFRYAPVES
ncbi:MAG: permease, partial [Firmicutes bacterium]|nr:permease [Bacillota bacterium]